jgi:hypothetical protein
MLKITRGWEAEGLAKEVKDHRDGNLEASGMTVACSLHQAVPGSFQITVPVEDI